MYPHYCKMLIRKNWGRGKWELYFLLNFSVNFKVLLKSIILKIL